MNKPTPGPWATGWGNGISGPGCAWRFRAFEASDETWRVKAKDEAEMIIGPSSVGTKANSMLAMLPWDENGKPNAALIVAAVNACFQINPENPLAVAEALPELVKAARNIEMGCSFPENASEKAILSVLRPILAKIEAKSS